MEKLSAIVFLPREGDKPSIMLEPVLFDPAALWLCEDLKRAGVERFLVVCHHKDRERAAACFPEGTFLLTEGKGAGEEIHQFLDTPGRVILVTEPVFLHRAAVARLAAGVTEPPAVEKRAYAESGLEIEDLGIYELSGQMMVGDDNLKADLVRGAKPYRGFIATAVDDFTLQGSLNYLAIRQSVERLQESGVRFIDRNAVYIGPRVTAEAGTTILPGTILRGETHIGRSCTVGPNAVLVDTTLGEASSVNASQCYECAIGSCTTVGPFAYLRPGTTVGDHVRVGDFVELKNTAVGDETKISHLAYLGDCDVGEGSDIGCGTVTVNFDGVEKFRTRIGDGAFIGCNTNLVAPVRVGDGAYVAAGSTITRDVPSDSLAIARSQQTVKNNWAKKRRAKQEKK